MPESTPKVLTLIEKLMYEGKFGDALEKISNLEKKDSISGKDQLTVLILKGKILCYKEQYIQAGEFGELAYSLGQKLGMISISIDALLIKAHIACFEKLEKAFNFIKAAENLLNSISDESSLDLSKQKAYLLLIKSIMYRGKGDLNEALNYILQCVALGEQIGERIDISRIYGELGLIYVYKGNPNKALDCAMKSLEVQKGLNNQVGIAASLSLIGLCRYSKGELEQALKFCKQSLAVKEISSFSKVKTLHLIGAIYKERAEIDRTLSYYLRGAKLAEEENYIEGFIENIMGIGTIYRMKGDYTKAEKYLKHSLGLSKNNKSYYGMNASLFYLVLLKLDQNSPEEAQEFLNQLEKYSFHTDSNVFKQTHLIAKALILKKSGRIRDRTEAELLLKQIVENELITPQLYLLSIVNLCDLFLEELYMTNKIEILDEIKPLIFTMLKKAENEHLYLWLAETKLLQAKLALIQMDIDEAKRLLTQAQQIAELNGLNLLAIKISSEHDNLLEQLNVWDNLKKTHAPLSERVNLTSLKGIIDRMQGKSMVEPLELTSEIPVLLLIIAEGGIPVFSNPFTEDWDFEDDLIGGFLTAFNTFSGELFSNRLDRAKFGDYTILMQPVGPFSVGYLFKGHTYLAKQRFALFNERIRKTKSIWTTLIRFSEMNRTVELKDNPSLELLISEIFTHKDNQLNHILNEYN